MQLFAAASQPPPTSGVRPCAVPSISDSEIATLLDRLGIADLLGDLFYVEESRVLSAWRQMAFLGPKNLVCSSHCRPRPDVGSWRVLDRLLTLTGSVGPPWISPGSAVVDAPPPLSRNPLLDQPFGCGEYQTCSVTATALHIQISSAALSSLLLWRDASFPA
jgi:hypothetical protein